MNNHHLIKILYFVFLIISIGCNNGSIEENIVSLDNKEYKKLNAFVKNKFVVALGEYTHGDGELFELKTEIIEHLHKNLGFEAVLMESDFLSVEKTLPAISTLSKKEAANVGIQSTWADSKEFSSLISYLGETAKKGDTLYFHGFDPQMTGRESKNIHVDQATLIKNKISSKSFNHLISAITILENKDISKVTEDSLNILKNSVTYIKKTNSTFSSKTYQWLKNVEGNLKSLIYIKKAPAITTQNIPEIFSHPNYLKSSSIRDSLMADNINYYLKKYNKVIIWAANKHIQLKSDERTWMGELLKKTLGDKYYSILVLYNQGVWSYPQGHPNGVIPESVEGTLAFKISNATNSDIVFLDINSTQIPKMKVRENNFMVIDSVMIENYGDAILYVRTATGSTLLDK